MDNVKISVSFTIPGSVMDKEKNSKGELVNYTNLSFNVIGKKGRYETLKTKLPKCKLCIQNINMTKETYDNILTTPVHKFSASYWKRLPAKQRIAEFLKDMQNDLHASSFEFTILED